jgi:LmbE family N-acetylglucosaminyl deacetylase
MTLLFQNQLAAITSWHLRDGINLGDGRDTIWRVMVIVAHPDDAESWAGGTIANFACEDKSCAYVVVTSGEKRYPDCEVEDTRQLRPDITRQIRRFRPHVPLSRITTGRRAPTAHAYAARSALPCLRR